MKIEIEMSGLGLEISGFALNLFWGDFYARLPHVGEIAWNHTGLYANRLPIQPEEYAL